METNKGENYLGNVIRIISKTTLIIDVGEDDLTVGDKVQIYTVADEINDLYGNSLGVYEHIKDTLDVVQTSKNYSVCEKLVKKSAGGVSALAALATSTITYKQGLKVKDDEIQPLSKLEDNNEIHLGDFVKKY